MPRRLAHDRKRQSLGVLTLAALGVVYGDIGTSPLYTMKEVFNPAQRGAADRRNVIGAVSTIFWALMVVVTLKYVVLILRADNRGEGGIMALTALAAKAAGSTPARRTALLLTGVFGAALFYGDSVITPAISVLGAVEGLEIDHAGAQAVCAAALGGGDRRAVPGAALRHGGSGQAVRPGDRDVVRGAGRHRARADRAAAGASLRR